MTDGLSEWLRTQLDEDERIARAATPGPWEQDPERVGFLASAEYWYVVDCSGARAAAENAAHIAAHDPARVLREIDAKRQIIAAHPATRDVISVAPDGQHGFGCATCHQDEGMIIGYGWCATLRALALSYADRPDYRPETE